MTESMPNTSALTWYSIGIGVASGIGAMLLASRLTNSPKVTKSSVIMAVAITSAVTILAAYIIEPEK